MDRSFAGFFCGFGKAYSYSKRPCSDGTAAMLENRTDEKEAVDVRVEAEDVET